MRQRTLTELKLDGYKLVGVQFPGTKKIYTYLTDLDLKMDEEVIVHCRGKFVVVTVRSFNVQAPQPDVIKYQWIVSKIDTTNWDRVKDIVLI